MARKIQSENRRLQKVAIECLSDVPFDRETAPVTWQLIEQARRLASINDDFKAQYMKAIGARMTFATFMRADHPKIFSVYDKKIEHRGRKPKGFACKV